MNSAKKGKVALVFIVCLILLNIFSWQEVFNLVENKYLKVIFFDVGQGDAIFIETPQKHQILIDGGPDSEILEKLGRVLPFWDRKIDLVILTHPEKDHISGLIEVLKSYKVEYILWTGIIRDTSEYKKWKELIREERARIIIAQAGQKIVAGEALFNILYPLEKLEGEQIDNSNDTSVVSRLVFNQNSLLFTGDISKQAEEKITEQKFSLASDVLKVSHHGSKYSTFEKFLDAVSPEIAVIQVGENNYNHPTQEVLERLNKLGIEILRTDRSGDIELISDGNNIFNKNN